MKASTWRQQKKERNDRGKVSQRRGTESYISTVERKVVAVRTGLEVVRMRRCLKYKKVGGAEFI